MSGRAPALAPIALAAVVHGCAGSAADGAAEPAPKPPRPGAPLVQFAPAGADAIAHLDIARLRDSEGLGELVEAVRGRAGGGGFDLLAADELLLASYHLGTESAQTLTLLRGDGVAAIAGAEELAERTAAIGPPELVDVAAGAGGATAASNARLMELFGAAMPEAAPGAALRAGGELDFDARVGLSRLLSLSDVPVAISVWGDVVDDLAVIAILGAASEDEARAVAGEARAWREWAAREPRLARYGLSPAVRRAEVEASGRSVRVTLVVPPERLARAASAAMREAGALSEDES